MCCAQRLMGLWVALILGYGVTTAIAVVAVLRSDWPALAAAALARSEKAVQPAPSVAVLPVIAETLSEPETEFTMFADGEGSEAPSVDERAPLIGGLSTPRSLHSGVSTPTSDTSGRRGFPTAPLHGVPPSGSRHGYGPSGYGTSGSVNAPAAW
jgi:hypothetical protein